MKTQTNKEFIPTRQEIKESTGSSFKTFASGSIFGDKRVISQIPFIMFVAIAILLYIFNQYRGENVMRQIMTLEKKVLEMRAESVSTAFDLQELSKQSEVTRMLTEQGLPLQEAKTPPYKIEMDQ